MKIRALKEKSILDERYEILSLKRKSEDGFLYCAQNLLNKQRVVIKEYCPAEYVIRKGARIVLVNPACQELFEELGERFLKAARAIRDFRDEPGIIRVLDYFKCNDTVYCVMEETQDVLLADRVKGEGTLEAETAFRAMVPVLETLQEVHKAGFLYRRIRPDSIGVTSEQVFRICDFGIPKEIKKSRKAEQEKSDAAKNMSIEKENRTRLSTAKVDGYTPPERMEDGMTQGPWSDLYSVAAVLYFSVMGKEPEDPYERTLGEKLTLPSELGKVISPALEKIILKGLAVKSEERYQSAGEMLHDIESIFPKKDAESRKKRRWTAFIRLTKYGVLAAGGVLLCFEIFLSFHPGWLKFHGRETETIWLTASNKSDQGSLNEDWGEIEKRVKNFAGKRGYVWQQKERSVRLILPDDLFEEKGSQDALMKYLLKHTHQISGIMEQKVKWEDPKESASPGKYQKKPSVNINNPVLLIYRRKTDSGSEWESVGSWYRKFTDFKSMLDALETPYVIGVSRDHYREIVVKIDRNQIPEFYAESLDHSMTLDLAAGWSCMYAGGIDRVESYDVGSGKKGIRLLMKTDGGMSDYEKNLIKDYIQQAKVAGSQDLELLIGEITLARGKIPSQKELENGILSFPTIVLPDTKAKDVQLICRCLNHLNSQAANSGADESYKLLAVQNIDKQGKPLAKQSGLTIGNFRYLPQKEKTYIRDLAKQNGMQCKIKENLKARTISFQKTISSEEVKQVERKRKQEQNQNVGAVSLNSNTTADNMSVNMTGLIEEQLKTTGSMMQAVLSHTKIQSLFWDEVSVDFKTDANGYVYKVHTVLKPRDQIGFSYFQNLESTALSDDVDSRKYFGQIAVHGQLIRQRKTGTSADPIFWSFDEAVSGQKSDLNLSEIQTFLKTNSFFSQYGGSDTWEYGAN